MPLLPAVVQMQLQKRVRVERGGTRLTMPIMVGLPRWAYSTSIHEKPHVPAQIWVTMTAKLAAVPDETAEPPLNPNQPTHSRLPPITE